MSWKLAPALAALFAEINTEWPARDRTSDGTIGDTAHQARRSEHNPNSDPNDTVPDGMVTAADIDVNGINVKLVRDALIGEPRVWYVISAGHIYSRTHGWVKTQYNGADPHTGHIHVSLVQTGKACADTSPWGIYKKAAPPSPGAKETPFQRVSRIAHQRLLKIRALQAKLKRQK